MRVPVAVVGGGLAGASFAARLAAAGRDVVVIEREAGPHDKVCGEFLSWEAQQDLRDLGIDPLGLGAEPITTLGLAAGARIVTRRLPFQALSLSRRVLDEAVLAQAAQRGAQLRRGQAVMSAEPGDGGTRLRLDDGSEITAATVVLATGKHELRGHARPAGRQNDLIGFKMMMRLAADQSAGLSGRIDLILFGGGYAGLQTVEGGRANLCLLIYRDRFAGLGRSWPRLLQAIGQETPHLQQRLAGAEALWPKPMTIAGLPYGLVRRAADPDGFWRLGDQASVIPSFSGDGMSIALHSARQAARAFLRGDTVAMFQERLAADVGAQVARATWASRLFVHRGAQRGLMTAARLAPALLTLGVTLTRVPEKRRDLSCAAEA